MNVSIAYANAAVFGLSVVRDRVASSDARHPRAPARYVAMAQIICFAQGVVSNQSGSVQAHRPRRICSANVASREVASALGRDCPTKNPATLRTSGCVPVLDVRALPGRFSISPEGD